MLHKYCLQNRNIFYSINSRLQLPFFFSFFLPLSRLNHFNINKKSFFFKKFAISYSNLTLLLNFFMKKKKKKNCSHVKHYLQKIGPHFQYTYVGFYTIIYLYLYYYLRGFSCLDSSFFSSKIPLHPYIYVETKLKDNPVKIQL